MTRARSPVALPDDPDLPDAAALLDPQRAPGLLAAAVDGPVERARVRYLEYRPGRSIVVLVEVTAGGLRHEVVATHDRTASRLDRYPNDPGLPLLADPHRLADVLGLPRVAQARRLAWVPHRRAVLQAGPVVVKLYGTAGEAATAVGALRAVEGVLPTAGLRAAAVAEGAVAQAALPGTPLVRADAHAAAEPAAALLRTLHAADLGGLAAAGPDALLRHCDHVVELVRFARPDLAPRVDRVHERLQASVPAGLDLAPSHGDFNVGQLLRSAAGAPAVVDVDTLCRAPSALDLASYAANLVSGRDGDLAAARAALDLLVRSYGVQPPGLDWYLAASVLRRLDRPLRRWKKDWPRRTEMLLAAVEELAGR